MITNSLLDSYTDFEQKIQRYPEDQQLKLVTLMLYVGYSGESIQTIKRDFYRVIEVSQAFNQSELNLLLEEVFVCKFLDDESFQFQRIYKVDSADLFVSCAHYFFFTLNQHSLFETYQSNLSAKQSSKYNSYWNERVKQDNIIRDFFIDQPISERLVQLSYLLATVEFSQSPIAADLVLSFVALCQLKKCFPSFLIEDDYNLNQITQLLLKELYHGKLALERLTNCLTTLYELTSSERFLMLKSLLNHQFKGKEFAIKNELKSDFYQRLIPYANLINHKNSEVLKNFLSESGIADLSKEAKKKSSKNWKLLSQQKEVLLVFFLLREEYTHRDFLFNRYKFLLKSNTTQILFYEHLIDLLILFKTEIDVDCKNYKEDVLSYWKSYFDDAFKQLSPLSFPIILFLLKEVFKNEFYVTDEIVEQLNFRASSYHRKGLNWYASITAELCVRFNDEWLQPQFERMLVEDGFQLKNIFEQEDPNDWKALVAKMEKLADRLKEIDEEKKEQENATQHRLIWVVSPKYLQVKPFEQNRLKSGKWGKPKKISDQKLISKDIKGAIELDFEILNHAYQTNKGYYEDYVAYEVLEVWKRLEGHPNVVLEENIDQSVTVTKEEIEISVAENGDFYELNFGQDFNMNFPVKQESTTRFTYFNVDEKVKEWFSTFPQGVLIPKEAKNELKAVVGQLSRNLHVHSKVDEIREELPEISADTQLYALLTPKGNNIQLNLYFKPFSTQLPYVVPTKGKEALIEDVQRVRTRAVRDFRVEEEIIRNFFVDRPNLFNTHDGHFSWELTDRVEALNALMELQSGAFKAIIEWPKGVKFQLLASADVSQLSMSVKMKKTDWFHLDGELKINEEIVVSLMELLSKYKENPSLQFVEVRENQFISLTNKLRTQLAAFENFAEDFRQGIDMHPLVTYGILHELKEKINLDADQAWTEFEDRVETAYATEFSLPKNLQATLRDYQLDGYQWLSILSASGAGACLADDMGLGKTLQAITLLLAQAKDGASLVIAPSSVTFNWVKEIQKFAPTLNVHLLSEVSKRETLIKSLGQNDVLICSYGLLQTGIPALRKKGWNVIILDEAQAIKNRSTKRSEEAMKLKAKTRILTTGTPIENNLGELWNLFQFINPGLLGDWESFNDNYILRITSDDDLHAKVARRNLRKIIAPFILRRTKSEVLEELPQKTEMVLNVKMSEEESIYYEALRRTAIGEIEDIIEKKKEGGAFKVLAELTKLRQACCHPTLINHEWQWESSKLSLFLETVKELKAGGHRALVFSQFVSYLNILKVELEKEGVSYQYLDGSTTLKNREKAVNDFQSGEGDVFLISLKAGGTGLNLTTADYVIHMDPWWNPAVEDQATDRAYRIGQERPVTVYRLITQNTIEEKMIQLHHEKRQLADDLLSESATTTKLDTKELLKLITEF
ncbi:DEAD/DEAH box helicase [Sediminitomix flava]|uniref:SNF2 family DNA or RNA helicase n=1 Tax=Sediminitomix flava TaxID=379075 RepID=A0A315ZBL4_SEDFL|nr:DEAD/DEAH box helicase [Sediminitomix flava]PWJ42178.1 SNF2 family DNA or RNA helicase [Sediminitomix flava]